MNEDLQKAFEKWWINYNKTCPIELTEKERLKWSWDACSQRLQYIYDHSLYQEDMIVTLTLELEQERQRSKQLVEALRVINWHMSDDGSHDPDEVYDISEKALKEYRGEK